MSNKNITIEDVEHVLGIVYFDDGHTEDVTRYEYLKKGELSVIEFHTKTGTYLFRECLDFIDGTMTSLVRCINKKQHEFLYIKPTIDCYGYLDCKMYPAPIEKIELKEDE